MLSQELLGLHLDLVNELSQDERLGFWRRGLFKGVDLGALCDRSLQNNGTHHHLERGSLSIGRRSGQRGTAGEQKREVDAVEHPGAERVNWELRNDQRHFHTPLLR